MFLTKWIEEDTLFVRRDKDQEIVSAIALTDEKENWYCGYIRLPKSERKFEEVKMFNDLLRLKMMLDIKLIEFGYKISVGI